MTRDEIFEVVRRNMEQIVEGTVGRDIVEERTMRDYGADSLEIVQVVFRSMNQLRIRVPRAELAKCRNLADLLDSLEAAASSGALR